MKVLGTIVLVVIELACLGGCFFWAFVLMMPRGYSLLEVMLAFGAACLTLHWTLIRLLKKCIPHYQSEPGPDFGSGGGD
ncbi:hypothetical protein [Sulfuriroseicoccus oceanibius]|uniref:Uncharacterized protein n=1 Tax=Sulfuriroseicoccus oceanibius TaxID=2707525 RepID=A0A6B3LDV0_9BACT|nr:hypothetical protein [Sulfuriroseicoccus oceanibius]QQL45045.1 hypothetical protein G3M56_000205 [Sulfuriroseicoccus oceanibius]